MLGTFIFFGLRIWSPLLAASAKICSLKQWIKSPCSFSGLWLHFMWLLVTAFFFVLLLENTKVDVNSLPKVFKGPFGLSADIKFPTSNVSFLLQCSWRKQCPPSLCCYPVVRALAGKWEFLRSVHASSLTTMLDWEEEEQEGNRESPPFRLKLWPCSKKHVSLEQGQGSWGKMQSKTRRCLSHLVQSSKQSPGVNLCIFVVNSSWIKNSTGLGKVIRNQE